MEIKDLKLAMAAMVDELVAAWSPVVIPILVKVPDSLNGLDGLGSGFIVTYQSRMFLVTALHVLNEALKYEMVGTNISGQGVIFHRLIFATSPEHDLAVTELREQWLLQNEVKTIKCIDLARGVEWQGVAKYTLMGYPASKNKLRPAYKQTDRYLYSITADLHEIQIGEEIKDGILFAYNPKTTVNSSLINPGGKPPLHGMSGGPAFEVILNESTLQYSLGVRGVLCRWKKNKKAIVAAPASVVIDLIESKLLIMK